MPGKYRAEIGRGTGGSSARREFQVVDGGGPPTEPSMRELRRRYAGSVCVVTARDERGFRGITVTAFCVVSLDPPTVLVCLASEGEALAAVAASGTFAVSILSDTQEFLADQFAGRAPLVNRRFDGVRHRLTTAGNPVLEDCLAWFDCAVSERLPAGDHAVVIGQVREAGYGTGSEPLLYFDGAYRSLGIDY
jgi:flavin reductase (DIM6/NTAB) family NADH-FMN oxidoreductase RutF